MEAEINECPYKLKRQAKNIRKMIICLGDLIDSSEIPIKLNIELLQNHKNFQKVWEEIGVIPYAYVDENGNISCTSKKS